VSAGASAGGLSNDKLPGVAHTQHVACSTCRRTTNSSDVLLTRVEEEFICHVTKQQQ